MAMNPSPPSWLPFGGWRRYKRYKGWFTGREAVTRLVTRLYMGVTRPGTKDRGPGGERRKTAPNRSRAVSARKGWVPEPDCQTELDCNRYIRRNTESHGDRRIDIDVLAWKKERNDQRVAGLLIEFVQMMSLSPPT